MDHRGPIYCETVTNHALDAWVSFEEPFNVVTNIAPILGAAFAYAYMRRVAGFSWGASILALLATATGIGSFFWHYTRDPSWLPFDVLPGVAFLLVFIYVWVYVLSGRWRAYAVLVAFVAFIGLVGWLLPSFTAIALSAVSGVGVLGVSLIAWTFRQAGASAGWWSVGLLGVAAMAAVARTVDMSLCGTVPTGTHFFWHVGLGFGVYLAIRMYLDICYRNTANDG